MGSHRIGRHSPCVALPMPIAEHPRTSRTGPDPSQHRWTRVRVVDAVALTILALAIVTVPGRVDLGFWSFQSWAWDAWAYWDVDPVHPYAGVARESGAFLYGPPIAQVAAWLRVMPWEVYVVSWTALMVGVLYALAPGRSVMLLLLPPIMLEVLFGNIHLLLAAAIVLGFRWPAAWAFVLLTKVTPGVGLAWFVARRDWRSLAVALGATAIAAAASYVVAPWMWSEWIARLSASAAQQPSAIDALFGPLWLRVLIGAAIAFGAGLLGRRWPVAVACTLALPQLSLISFSVLVAVIPLVALDRRHPLPRDGQAPGLVALPHGQGRTKRRVTRRSGR